MRRLFALLVLLAVVAIPVQAMAGLCHPPSLKKMTKEPCKCCCKKEKPVGASYLGPQECCCTKHGKFIAK